MTFPDALKNARLLVGCCMRCSVEHEYTSSTDWTVWSVAYDGTRTVLFHSGQIETQPEK